jgi:hypothetical protein
MFAKRDIRCSHILLLADLASVPPLASTITERRRPWPKQRELGKVHLKTFMAKEHIITLDNVINVGYSSYVEMSF